VSVGGGGGGDNEMRFAGFELLSCGSLRPRSPERSVAGGEAFRDALPLGNVETGPVDSLGGEIEVEGVTAGSNTALDGCGMFSLLAEAAGR
jgi:hypothetical protein